MIMLMKTCYKVLAVFLLFFGCSATQKPDFAPQQPHIKIVTYNVNWGFLHPDKVARYLSVENADVVCLQETHRYWKESLNKKLNRQYPYGKFREWGNAGGIAIISKYELYDANLIEPNDTWFPAFYARAKTPIGIIQILTVHLKPPLSAEGKLSATAYLKTSDEHIAEIEWFLRQTDPNQPMIILGDFNENEKDKAIRRLIKTGWTDALSRYDKKTNTWVWKTSAGLELKNRYDHILYNRFLDCTAARVTNIEASDHFPVTAIIIQKQMLK
jgi:endonuclease/exonuclease/phosphatase family metal-dependent hydrolase